MVTINLSEVSNKDQIAEIIRYNMQHNGITKSEIIAGTHLSKSAVNSVLAIGKSDKDYMFGTLLKVLSYLKIKIFIGRNEDAKNKVLSLF